MSIELTAIIIGFLYPLPDGMGQGEGEINSTSTFKVYLVQSPYVTLTPSPEGKPCNRMTRGE